MKQLIWPLIGRCFARPGPAKSKTGSRQARVRTRPETRRRSGLALLSLPGFWLNLALALTVGLGLTASLNNSARAQVVTPAPLENSIYDSDTFKVADQLQCPVCQGVTVAYSNSGLAQQMRLLIKKKLEAGETREQILQYFVDRYGESILTNPPKSGFTLLVWLLPVVGLLVGAGTVGYALRSWKARITFRAGRVQPGSTSSEIVTGTGEMDSQPANNKEGRLPETSEFPYSAGLDAEKLQEYQARVEAELATFAHREEWGHPPLPTKPGFTAQSSLSRDRDTAQTSDRKINPLKKG